jgi:7-carboxy-7-deazaguanine synthase
MTVCEIFSSIQGESSFAGIPCTFIRLTGCNLRCSYCDTSYAYYEGQELTVDGVIREVQRTGINLVEITGGEPLLQNEAHLLIKRLIDEGYKVLVETNGSQNIKKIAKKAIVILDIKTPGSGMSKEMDFSNLDYIKSSDEIKFVITNREDYEWSKDIIQKYKLMEKCKLLFSPAFGTLPPENLAKWIIGDKLRIRFNLQLHKYIFSSEQRGI